MADGSSMQQGLANDLQAPGPPGRARQLALPAQNRWNERSGWGWVDENQLGAQLLGKSNSSRVDSTTPAACWITSCGFKRGRQQQKAAMGERLKWCTGGRRHAAQPAPDACSAWPREVIKPGAVHGTVHRCEPRKEMPSAHLLDAHLLQRLSKVLLDLVKVAVVQAWPGGRGTATCVRTF